MIVDLSQLKNSKIYLEKNYQMMTGKEYSNKSMKTEMEK